MSSSPGRFLFLLLLVDRPMDAVVLFRRALCPDRLWLTLRYESPDARSWRLWLLRLRHLSNIAGTREV